MLGWRPNRLATGRELRARLATLALVLIAAAGALVPSTSTAATTPPPPPPGDGASGYFAVTPARIMDTTTNLGHTGMIPANTAVTFKVIGKGGIPSQGVAAAVLDATVPSPSGGGDLFIYRAGATRPSTSSIHFATGVSFTGLISTKVSSTGQITIYSTLPVNLRIDTAGWYDAFTLLNYDPTKGAQFHSLPATRVVNTQTGLGGHSGTVANGGTLSAQLTGVAGTPSSGVVAVALDVSAVGPASAGAFSIYPAGTTAPSAVQLSFRAGRTTTGLSFSRVSSGGAVTILNRGGATNIWVDVVGYYQHVGSDIVTGQSSLIPAVTLFGPAAVGSSTFGVQAGGAGHVPVVGADSVLLLVSVSGATAAGKLIFYDPAASVPSTSAVSYAAGQTLRALAIAPLNFDDSSFDMKNTGATATVTLRAIGWFAYVIPPPPIAPPPPGAATTSKLAIAPISAPGTRRSPLVMSHVPSGVAKLAAPSAKPASRRAVRRLHAAFRGEALAPTVTSDALTGPIPFDVSHVGDWPTTNWAYLSSNQVPKQVGRLWSQVAGANSGEWCSATVISRDVVLTAAHCVVNPATGTRYNQFLFVPAQYRYSAPYGNWWDTDGKSTYWTGFLDNTDTGYGPLDYAMIKFPANSSGQYLGDVVGWFNPLLNSQASAVITEGYSTAGYFDLANGGLCSRAFNNDTCIPVYSRSDIRAWSETPSGSGKYDIGFGAIGSPGTSGGPIFEWNNGDWWLASVNSHFQFAHTVCNGTCSPDTVWYFKEEWGPYLDSDVSTLLSIIESR
jgi:Trypsin